MSMATEDCNSRDECDQWAVILHRLLHRPAPLLSDDHDEYQFNENEGRLITRAHRENSPPSSPSIETPSTAAVACIQSLPPDATSHILIHLHPHDLFNYSITSTRGNRAFCNEVLWRNKFLARWNCPDVDVPSDCQEGSSSYWRRAYKAAHKNTHDLWIRHWNIVYPEDVTTCPGRTVIPNIRYNQCNVCNEEEQNVLERSYNSTVLSLCPTCRYHPMLQGGSGYNPDIIQAIHDELEYDNNDATEQMVDPVKQAEIVGAAHSLLVNDPSMGDSSLTSTMARTIHYSTMYSVAKWCRNIRLYDAQRSDECINNSSLLHRFHNKLSRKHASDCQNVQQKVQDKAIHAFECASTYNRCINTNQYSSSGLHFLTDALFFNIHPSYEKDRTSSASWRSKLGCSPDNATSKFGSHLEELLQDVHASPRSVSELGPKFETSSHSWHIIRLTNPDFVRPIVYRAYIQCTKAFTVFPSQGYLKGGETVYLVLGVRMHGSLLNEAFEAVDVEREQADPAFASLHANKGHLPFVPFVIRYMFAPFFPCLPHDFITRPENNQSWFANPQLPSTQLQSVIDHIWDNVTAEYDVRTIPISCHVHSNYSLDEFQSATLMPFEQTNKNFTPLTTVMPNLMERDRKLFVIIQNLDAEVDKSTEKACKNCKRDWGPQSEILGRAWILRQLDIERHSLIYSKQQSDFLKTLHAIPLMLNRVLADTNGTPKVSSLTILLQLNRILQLLYIMMTDYLVQKRANRFVTKKERQFYSSCEQYLDSTYNDVEQCIRIIEWKIGKSRDTNVRKWRIRGVYKYPRCADWVLNHDGIDNDTAFKSEPIHLKRFGVIEHSTGIYNFGRQDDNNHESFRTSLGCQPPMHTDMFHDNAIQGLMIAVATIERPESLIGHGVYDRVEKSGAVIRCPSFPCNVFFRVKQKRSRTELTQLAIDQYNKWMLAVSSTQKHNRELNVGYLKSVNFEFNDRDPDGLNLAVFGMNEFVINYQTTMGHFLSNTPVPGQGRLLLSSSAGECEKELDIISIYSRVQPYTSIILPGVLTTDNNSSSESNSITHNARNQQPQPNNNIQENGMADLNIVWLVARHLGWTVDDHRSRGEIIVDRRILIAVQWFSNTIMTFSLLGSLLSRKFKLIRSTPADFHFLFGGRIQKSSHDMRFWTAEECGFAALIVFGFYFVLGRSSERHVGRTYEREMRDSIQDRSRKKQGATRAVLFHISQLVQRLYDNVCPWMIQKRLFVPLRNRRSGQEVMDSIAYQRSVNYREHRPSFSAIHGRGHELSNNSRDLGFWSYVLGLSFALLSFLACSPHFVVNSLTVFCCSLSFGMSMSIESLENVRRTTRQGVLSMVKPRRLNTLVIGYILIGQLVGGSGGVIFLAEFVVTSVCLILGGAATITSRAVESWITFVCLASTAFWGFVFARLGLLDAVKKRRRGVPSALLCASLCSSLAMWIGVFTRVDWQALTPGDLVLIQVHHLLTEIRDTWRANGGLNR